MVIIHIKPDIKMDIPRLNKNDGMPQFNEVDRS